MDKATTCSIAVTENSVRPTLTPERFEPRMVSILKPTYEMSENEGVALEPVVPTSEDPSDKGSKLE